jgi:6-pyruvoyltetrahydropterin/6-carboxytetrahydropterin synthase
MAFEITVRREFSAAHALQLSDGKFEDLHGHNWIVAVTVRSEKLDSIGTVMDFHELEKRVNAVVDPLQNRNLNDSELFRDRNPSAENVAAMIAGHVELPNGVRLISVEVWETSSCGARYLA